MLCLWHSGVRRKWCAPVQRRCCTCGIGGRCQMHMMKWPRLTPVYRLDERWQQPQLQLQPQPAILAMLQRQSLWVRWRSCH